MPHPLRASHEPKKNIQGAHNGVDSMFVIIPLIYLLSDPSIWNMSCLNQSKQGNFD